MVAIKDFDMPSCCANCDFCVEDKYADKTCVLLCSECINEKHRDDNCPLVEIKERKVGKILVSGKYRVPMYECLGCKNPVMEFWKYCPSCGNNIEECKNG